MKKDSDARLAAEVLSRLVEGQLDMQECDCNECNDPLCLVPAMKKGIQCLKDAMAGRLNDEDRMLLEEDLQKIKDGALINIMARREARAQLCH